MAEESIGDLRRDFKQLEDEVVGIRDRVRDNYMALLSGDKDRSDEIKELQKQVAALEKTLEKEVSDLKAKVKDLDGKVAKIKK